MSETSFGAPVKMQRGDGTLATFPLLSMRQLAEIQAGIRATRVALAKKHCTERKADPTKAAEMLTAIESSTIFLNDVRLYAETPEGTIEVLKKSLGEDAWEAEVKGLSSDQVIEAAVKATGWTPPPAAKDAPANPANADAK